MRKALRLLPLALVACGLLATPAVAQTPSPELKAGDAAPDFTLPATDGKTYSLKDLEGALGRAGMVPESVHRWLNGRMQLAP